MTNKTSTGSADLKHNALQAVFNVFHEIGPRRVIGLAGNLKRKKPLTPALRSKWLDVVKPDSLILVIAPLSMSRVSPLLVSAVADGQPLNS